MSACVLSHLPPSPKSFVLKSEVLIRTLVRPYFTFVLSAGVKSMLTEFTQ